jgi:RND family efflux transporter MFP subunit
MSAFGFKFRKKPIDFSKMKENGLANNNRHEADDEADMTPTGKSPKKLPNIKLPSKKVISLIILAVFILVLIFVMGPRFGSQVAEKIKVDKLLEKVGLRKPSPEEALITPAEEEIEELVTVRTYRVARADFIDVLPGMGTIRGDHEIELRFSVNGIVDSINFFEGDLVRKGDIIATLDQKDALLKLEYAKSKLKTEEVAEMAAAKKLEIHQQLYDQGIIIKPKLEEVRLEYEAARTRVQAAQKEVEFSLAELDKTYLYSPIDGVMGTRDVEVGEFVNSNIKIASVYEVSTVLAEMGVIEKDINRVALGQKAKVSVDTYPGVEFEGKIDSVAPIIEGKSRTLTVKIKLKNDNPKGTLLPGMFARIWVSVYEKKNTIKVPSACVYDLDNNGEFDSVYAVDEDNIAKAKPVSIGYVSTDYIEVTDGLLEGEQVVSEAMAELKDGVRVDVIEVQEALF